MMPWALLRVLGAGAVAMDKNLNSKNYNFKNTDISKIGKTDFKNLNMLKIPDLNSYKMSQQIKSSTYGFNGNERGFGLKDYSTSQNQLSNKADINFLQKLSTDFKPFNDLNALRTDNEKSTTKVSDTSKGSTLSIHIDAYENATKAYKKAMEKDKNNVEKPKKSLANSYVTSTIQNTFEIPRQQTNEPPPPEVMQFKASQKLLNPNGPPPKKEIPRHQTNGPLTPEVSHFRASKQLLNLNEPPPKKDKKDLAIPKPATSNPIKNKLQQDLDLLKSAFDFSSDNDGATSSQQFQAANKTESNTSLKIDTALKSKQEKDQKRIDILSTALNASNKKIEVVEEEKKELEVKLQRARDDLHNLKRKQTRTIESTDKKKEDLENEIAEMKNQMKEREEEFIKEIEKFKNLSNEDRQTIQTLKNEIFELNEELKEFTAKQGIAILYVDGKYTPETKHGMARLKILGVANEKAPEVITTVLDMVGLVPNRVPSASTVARASFYLKALNESQLREILRDAAARDISTTLGSDETTKNGKKLEAFVLYTLDELNKAREYCLGMVDILDKSAATAIEKLKKIIQHLESEEGENLWEIFVMSVGNVMSDQAATQKKFNNLLEALKKVIVENDERYMDLDPEQKQDLYKLRKFYCQLHILQNATPVVTNILLEHEKRMRGNDKLTEATVVKFIKDCAKLTGECAASRYDVHGNWITWASKNNVKFATVPDFKGHRFNILFAIAGAVQYLKEDLLNFNKEFKTQLRDICFEEWMNDPLTSSHLLLLAAVNEFITAPFWRLTEHDTNISSITAHAQSLIDFLERVKKEPMLLLTGEPPLQEYEEDFEITQRSKAHIEKLDKTQPQHPLIISEAIEDVAEALVEYFKKQFKEFLPGGDHYQSAENTVTVPRSNRKCESIFGLTTWDFQHAPNKRTVVREAKILGIVNKVFEWFDRKTPEEKERIIKEAIAAAPQLEADAAAQQKALEDETWKRLLQQKEADDKAELVKTRKQREAFDKIQKYGGEWKSVALMETALNSLGNESEKKKAIIANLRYHQLVLKTEASNSKLFTVTAKGKPKTLDTLCDNLKAVITIAKENANEDDESDDEY